MSILICNTCHENESAVHVFKGTVQNGPLYHNVPRVLNQMTLAVAFCAEDNLEYPGYGVVQWLLLYGLCKAGGNISSLRLAIYGVMPTGHNEVPPWALVSFRLV